MFFFNIYLLCGLLFLLILSLKYPKQRNPLVLVASLVLYLISNTKTNLVFFIFIVTAFYFWYYNFRFFKTNKFYFGIFVIALLSPLIFNKYIALLDTKLTFLPTGISFISFIALGYFIDSRKSKRKGGILQYLRTLLFFPLVTSGPIVRTKQINEEFNNRYKIDLTSINTSLLRITVGLFQKFVVANQIALYVNQIYQSPNQLAGWPILFAIFLFSFQLYYDFSGYTNMALGVARLFGIILPENFKLPYLSESFSQFWTRWHITLSSWLRDYVYIPLGGSRKGRFRTYLNIFITFLVSGVWHGNTILFILWGLLHGAFVSIDKLLTITFNHKFVKLIRTVITFLLISYLWVLFRSQDLQVALDIFQQSIKLSPNILSSFNQDLIIQLEISIFFTVLTFISEVLIYKKIDKIKFLISKNHIFIMIMSLLILMLLFFGVFTNQDFYYAKF